MAERKETMKYGKTLKELVEELDRQAEAKVDFLVDTPNLVMDAIDGGHQLTMKNDAKRTSTIFGVNDIAHRQIGSILKIPAPYYDKMRMENPELLATNVNSWFNKEPARRMIRTLDGTARAFLSDRYRRIDNYDIAHASLPLILGEQQMKVASCEITDQRMYIKVVNPRLQTEVVPGDYVQSGLIISNSEVGMGSVTVQPLIYRLVCSNGMVVNDAATRKYHIGRGNKSSEDYTLYSDATLEADDKALMMKVQDTVRAVVDEVQFQKVVKMMRDAKDAKITGRVPQVVELASADYGFTKKENDSILEQLIKDGDYTLYGLANAVTRAAQDVESYDRSTEMESIGYTVMNMSRDRWNKINTEIPA